MSPVESFRPTAGPVVIVGRPHSGSRALAGLLRIGGVFLGADLVAPELDSLSWYQRFVVPLVTSRFFPDWATCATDEGLYKLCEASLCDVWTRYYHPSARGAPCWGWKYCESLFTIPLLRWRLPGLRVIHLVRDGRDVCLSRDGFFQIGGPLADPPGWDPPTFDGPDRPTYARFCRAVAFLDPDRTEWHDIDLADPTQRARHRYLLHMQAWLTSVTMARGYAGVLGERFHEIRYEDLCTRPHETARTMFDWLGIPLGDSALRFLDSTLHARRVAAWRRARLSQAQRRDFDDACTFGSTTLDALGYRT